MAKWDKTCLMKRRLTLEGRLYSIDGRDYYQGRPVIHRNSQVDGGVNLGEEEREAIVVDSQKYPKLKELYEVAKGKATEGGTIKKHKILQAVYDTVAEAMPIQDSDAVERLIRTHRVEKDGKIALDVFIENGIGVCRHYALACAALLELFKKEGFTKGRPSIDRNSTHLGGHAWCRYTNSGGEVFILDVAQEYKGRLIDAPKEGWFYERPEDCCP